MIVEEKSKEEFGATGSIHELRKMSDNFVRTYDEGVKAGMIERITEDLEAAASRIAILEEELEAERAKKWSAVSKLKMIEHHKGNIGELRYCLEHGEALTLHDKIELIKEGFVL